MRDSLQLSAADTSKADTDEASGVCPALYSRGGTRTRDPGIMRNAQGENPPVDSEDDCRRTQLRDTTTRQGATQAIVPPIRPDVCPVAPSLIDGVRVVPVTVIAEPDKPMCRCERPSIAWTSRLTGVRPRYYWLCSNCLAVGFVAMPRTSNFVTREGSPLDAAVRAMVDQDDFLDLEPDFLRIYAKWGEDLYARRSGTASFDAASNDSILRDAVRDIVDRYEKAERARETRERQRELDHRRAMARIEDRINRGRSASRRGFARRPRPSVDQAYPVIVRGTDVVLRLIYGLIDPLEPARIRYVGRTEKGGSARFFQHVARPDQSPRGRWIAELQAAGRNPDMVLLETPQVGVDIDELERWWIVEARRQGFADLNVSSTRLECDRPAVAL